MSLSPAHAVSRPSRVSVRRRLCTPRALAALVAVICLGLAACGSRLSADEAQQQLAAAYGAAGSSVGAAGVLGDDGPVAGGGDVAAVGAGGSAVAPSGGPGGTTSGTTGGSGAGRVAGSAPKGAPGPAGDKKPIVVGMIGGFSGVIGANLAPARDAYAAWVQSVNARGGLNGHQIKLLIADNGNRASQDLALAKEFVEKKNVIALVNLYPAADADESLAKYAESKGVPIVGGVAAEAVWNASPMMFPAMAAGDSRNYALAKSIKSRGKTKFGVIYCTEGTICRSMKDRIKRHAQSLGLQMVYEGSVSLAQPDFTAQCVEARNRGAEAMVPIVDVASIMRFTQACERQAYKPLIVTGSAPAEAPSYMEGVVTVPASFPWFLQSGSPALNEYGAALKKYVSTKHNSFTSQGWVAGLLLGKALEKVSDEPTSKDVLEGLWRLRGETLGGLVPPLTFARGKPAPDARCAFEAVVKGGQWTAPSGVKLSNCKP